ncbi:MAG: hypothetical protein LBU51_05380 [Bacteroidales bacterium]|jgi:hypothetical protein|nr:hypothetical protein [Bacteroidales bacterium]
MATGKILKLYCINHLRTGYGKEDVSTEKFLENLVEYDPNGNVLKEENYLAEDELNVITLNEYDEHGRLIITTQYDAFETLIQKTKNEYDDQGNIIAQDKYYGDEDTAFTSRFIFENGLLVKQVAYIDDEKLNVERELTYNSQGLLEKEIEFDEDEKPLYINSFEYNEDKLVVKQVREEVFAKDKRTFSFEYDDRKNRVKELVYNFDEILIAKSLYQFDDDHHVVEKEEESLDHYQRMSYHYEEHHIHKIEIYDKKNTLISWTEYEHNADGQVSLIKHFGTDETDENDYRLRLEYEYVYEM